MEKKTIKLHKYQDEAIFAKERYVALIAGLQSGKTIAGCVWSRLMYDRYKNDAGLIAAPTYKILMQSTVPKFFEINPDLKKYYKKGDSEIDAPGRGKIYIRSTENPNVIEGMTLKWIWADEAGQMKQDAWINFQGRLSILKGELFITTTPYTMNWLANEFYDSWKKGVRDYKVVQFRSIDNPYFPEEEYNRVKETMDARVFRRRYEGKLEKMEGLVYIDFYHALHVKPKKEIRFKEIIGGIDWGYTNPTAVIAIGIDKDNTFWIIDEYYKREKTKEEIIEHCKHWQNKYNIRLWYPDPADPEALEQMTRAGIYPREVKKGKGSIVNGINTTRNLIKRNQFKVFETCKFTLEELGLYRYPEEVEGGNEKEEPIKENDHALDAIRYAIQTYQPYTNTIVQRFDNNKQIIFK